MKKSPSAKEQVDELFAPFRDRIVELLEKIPESARGKFLEKLRQGIGGLIATTERQAHQEWPETFQPEVKTLDEKERAAAIQEPVDMEFAREIFLFDHPKLLKLKELVETLKEKKKRETITNEHLIEALPSIESIKGFGQGAIQAVETYLHYQGIRPIVLPQKKGLQAPNLSLAERKRALEQTLDYVVLARMENGGSLRKALGLLFQQKITHRQILEMNEADLLKMKGVGRRMITDLKKYFYLVGLAKNPRDNWGTIQDYARGIIDVEFEVDKPDQR